MKNLKIFFLGFIVSLISSTTITAQLGPLNWTEPVHVEANGIFLLWHDNPTVGDKTFQKLYDFNFLNKILPVDSTIDASVRQEDSRTGPATFTDVATGKFNRSERENVVSIWGVGASGISIMIPRLDTSAALWSSTVQDSIVGAIQSSSIYVRTIDVDGDSLDEFIVAYVDNSDSIVFNLFDVDSSLQSTLIATYSDKQIIANHSNFMTTYTIETGDLNDDGTEELVLSRIDNLDASWTDVEIQIYDFSGSTFIPKGSVVESQQHNTGNPATVEFVMGGAIGDFIPDKSKEIAITMIEKSPTKETDTWILDVSSNLNTISSALPPFDYQLSASGGIHLSVSAGDIVGDSLDEILFVAGRTLVIISTTGVLSLEYSSTILLSGANFGDNDLTLNNFLDISDVNQDGQNEIVVVHDLLQNNLTSGFAIKVFNVDSNGAPNLIGERSVEENQPNSNGDYLYRPYSIAVGNFDGLNFTIGAPIGNYSLSDAAQPVIVLKAPPVHFDMFGTNIYDLNECYNGSVCDFGATYKKQSTTSVEVSTTVEANWAISAGLSVSGSQTSGISGTPLGVGVSASVSQNYEFYALGNYGENFSQTNTNSSSITVGVEITAREDDRIYATVTNYDIWEYPLYHGNETGYRSTILTYEPVNVQGTWFGSKSYTAVNLVPDHEVGNILSYPAYPNLLDNPNLEQAIAADYNNDSYVLDGSSSYNWFLVHNDFQSSNASEEWQWGLSLGITAGGYTFKGDYDNKTMNTHTTTISNSIELDVELGSLDMSIGDAKYTVTPYAYWGKNGSLVVDYAVQPELSPPGFPLTWWQQNYGVAPDPTFVLPWKLDPEKGFAISEPAKRQQTKDIIFKPTYPNPGDTVTITARVRNFSLAPTTMPVDVHFFLGDPDAGGTPLNSVGGTNVVSTNGPIDAQSRNDVQLRWIVTSTIQNYPRIYAVLDPNNLITEVHDDNNKGFNVLGFSGGVTSSDNSPAEQFASLGPCYPNPFDGTTTIQYTLTASEQTSILVFDQMGRVVEQLVDDIKAPGLHEVTFDGSSLAPGLYYYSIRSGQFTDTKKMLVVR